MSEWWQTFFDEDYLSVWTPVLGAARTGGEADGLAALLGLEPGMRVLDAPCGFGRLTSVLAERGLDVLGVDASEPMIARARQAAGRFLLHDLREPLEETGFDAAFNVFSSIGYAGEEGDRAVLRTIARALRGGGRFVLETLHRDPVVRRIANGGPPGTRLPDGMLVVEDLRFDPVAGRVDTTWHWSGPNGTGRQDRLVPHVRDPRARRAPPRGRLPHPLGPRRPLDRPVPPDLPSHRSARRARMSVELSVHPLARPFTGRDVREAFADFATEAEQGLLLEYGPDDTSFLRFECDHLDITDSFTVERPCGDARLYETLYRFLKSHHAMLISEDIDPPVRVATESDLAVARVLAIPAAQIRVVHSANALLA